MVRNERGFAYPLTFCIILLASMFLAIQLEQYVTEQKFLKESENILKQEYYFLSSIRQTEKEFFETGSISVSGSYTFSAGDVLYSTTELTDTIYKVTYKLKIGTNPEITAYSYYDKSYGKMIKWLEKN